MRTLTKTIAIATLAAASPALADQDTQYWQNVTVNVALPDGFKLQNETVFRTSEARGFYEIENNFMAGKKLGKVVTAWLGYTFDPQYSHGTFTRREHRFRQQVNFDNFAKLGKVKLSGRLRLEERWREGQAGTGWRLRPQLKASTPLIGKATVSLSVEPFFNLNNTAFQTSDGLDRVRTGLSVGVPLGKRINLDFGYLNQHTIVAGGTDRGDHVLTAGLSASF
ncbi:MAG: DUF2490 domain-containing protein [Sphingomonadaceae bacterium]